MCVKVCFSLILLHLITGVYEYMVAKQGFLQMALKMYRPPAHVALWLVLQTLAQKVVGLNPITISHVGIFIRNQCLHRAGVLRAQWEHCYYTDDFHPLLGCSFKSVALITCLTLQRPQFLSLVISRIIMTANSHGHPPCQVVSN